MKNSEFEEREYEAPLYVQLQHEYQNVWSPGQVLEAHVGFDRAILASHPYFWGLHGFAMPPMGIMLADHPSEHWWRGHRFHHPLPNFSLNLFIQAKRPAVGARAPKRLEPFGIKGAYWKFNTEEQQQQVLESLARSAGNLALVCYACAAFHRVTELYAHSRAGSVVQQSTFPSALSLSGHGAWYYNAPGCSGVANPEFERIDAPSLSEQIAEFTSRDQDREGDNSFGDNLKRLSKSVLVALKEESVGNSSRTAVYFETLREIDRNMDFIRPVRYDDALRSFLAVATFARIFGLQWHTLAATR